jgi:hypothetical protein
MVRASGCQGRVTDILENIREREIQFSSAFEPVAWADEAPAFVFHEC